MIMNVTNRLIGVMLTCFAKFEIFNVCQCIFAVSWILDCTIWECSIITGVIIPHTWNISFANKNSLREIAIEEITKAITFHFVFFFLTATFTWRDLSLIESYMTIVTFHLPSLHKTSCYYVMLGFFLFDVSNNPSWMLSQGQEKHAILSRLL